MPRGLAAGASAAKKVLQSFEFHFSRRQSSHKGQVQILTLFSKTKLTVVLHAVFWQVARVIHILKSDGLLET